MYMHYTLFFNENSVMTVIMSSGDYILIIYKVSTMWNLLFIHIMCN